MKAKDFRNLRIIAREVTGWAREIERIVPVKPTGQNQAQTHGQNRNPYNQGAAQAQINPRTAPAPSLPPEYSYVTCKDCDTPAILLHVLARGSKVGTFAGYCPKCMVITHIDTIDREAETPK